MASRTPTHRAFARPLTRFACHVFLLVAALFLSPCAAQLPAPPPPILPGLATSPPTTTAMAMLPGLSANTPDSTTTVAPRVILPGPAPPVVILPPGAGSTAAPPPILPGPGGPPTSAPSTSAPPAVILPGVPTTTAAPPMLGGVPATTTAAPTTTTTAAPTTTAATTRPAPPVLAGPATTTTTVAPPATTTLPLLSGATTAPPTTVAATTTAPLPILPGLENYDRSFNVGRDLSGGPGTLNVPAANPVLSYAKAPGVPQDNFAVASQGANMQFSFNLSPGTYTVDLGFVETDLADCVEGKRVFNVYINEQIRLEAYDIFKTVGCQNAVKVTFLNQAVDPILVAPLVIRLQAVAGPSTLSYIRIRASTNQCVPEITSGTIKNEDHVAHAIPGRYPPRANQNSPKSYVDIAGAGAVDVVVDGRGSHTHLFDSATDRSGRIKSYLWTNAVSGQVVSRKGRFTFRAPLGTTRLRLKVVDTGCSTDEAETTITVTGSIQSGIYCYYYSPQAELLGVGTLLDPNIRPVYSARSTSLDLGFSQFGGSSGLFTARCIFAVSTSESASTPLNVDVFGSGEATLYKGPDLVVDTRSSSLGATVTASGLTAFELIYRRTSTAVPARVQVKVNNVVPGQSALSHDRSAVLPVIKEISPSSGNVAGGARVRITGFGLFLPLTVAFGSAVAAIDAGESNPSRLFVTQPAGVGAVPVTVTTRSGLVSNSVTFTYGAGCPDPVKFDIQQMGNLGDKVNSPTASYLWQDGRMYLGTRPGDVKVLSYNSDTLTITSVCTSEKLTDPRYRKADGSLSPRVILGLTFDPRDNVGMPYVSVSTLFWERQSTIAASNPDKWSNGAVVRLKPATPAVSAANPSQCLMFDKTVVANLPVSDSDHAINDLMFTQNGDLLIAVGGMTNGGLPYWKMGSTWEAKLSASIVIAHLSRPTFNGVIQYANKENLRLATPLSTDVETYTVGVRNLFRMRMLRDGTIYATDMGPNCGFGNHSYTCSEYNEAEAALRNTATKDPFPGQLITGNPNKCLYGGFRKDKLIKVAPSKYYGHPNLQRGGEECAWIDPNTNKVPKPFETAPPPTYQKPVALLTSAATGMIEYGSQHFCGALRGELILSSYKGFRTLRAKLAAGGDSLTSSQKMFSSGGLSSMENERGDLIFPKLIGGMPVARPRVTASAVLTVYNAVPYRFGIAGGGKLIIGGANFAVGATVTVGNSPCPVFSLTPTKIVCTVPPGLPGSRANVAVTSGGAQAVLPGAVLYMAV